MSRCGSGAAPVDEGLLECLGQRCRVREGVLGRTGGLAQVFLVTVPVARLDDHGTHGHASSRSGEAGVEQHRDPAAVGSDEIEVDLPDDIGAAEHRVQVRLDEDSSADRQQAREGPNGDHVVRSPLDGTKELDVGADDQAVVVRDDVPTRGFVEEVRCGGDAAVRAVAVRFHQVRERQRTSG